MSDWIADWCKDSIKGGWGAIQIGKGGTITPIAKTDTGKCAVDIMCPSTANLYSSDGGVRVEVLKMNNEYELETDRETFFGFSAKFPSNFAGQQMKGDSLSWCCTPAQFHGPDDLDASPPVTIGVGIKEPNQGLRWWITVSGQKGTKGTWDFDQPYLANKSQTWRHIILQMKMSKELSDLTVWARDSGDKDWGVAKKIKSITPFLWKGDNPVEGHYWKMGVYSGPHDTQSKPRRDLNLSIGGACRTYSLDDAKKAL